tara:strand:- start:410 stop:1243 length:834 start_codon:yes stop_codon:yes gene_type:complete
MKSISYLGPPGSYCEQAAISKYTNEKLFPMPTIPSVIESVQDGITDLGVVPIENSIEGSVTFTLDALIHNYTVNINSEIMLNISHSLISNKKYNLREITKIYSHPQAISQCRIYISKNLPQAELINTSSTSAAIENIIGQENTYGAIAHSRNAKSYDLNVLAEKIQDEKINITRFAVLGTKIPSPTKKDKTSFCFDFSDIDKPGQLINVMKLFSDAKINITKIESRPSKKELGKYIFWMDINGHIKDQKLKNIFDQVKQMTSMLKIIGSYPEATNII